ncbi:hypothetical protein C2845_PM10G10590 [Panicum miliaceum]|uniref:Uncharacterized protein n=1 Tax=Panicum miliaceum TaxID=4540 RepID=A0A3L6PAX8_PANMI|nr:hypothetical protein C2845_PM10G10590 [Panicum miliaceum]
MESDLGEERTRLLFGLRNSAPVYQESMQFEFHPMPDGICSRRLCGQHVASSTDSG